MSSEQDRVMRAMEDAHRGNAAGRKLGYDRDLRRIVPIDDQGVPINCDPDRITAVTPKDMEHFGNGRRTGGVIVLGGEQIQQLADGHRSCDLAFLSNDQGDVYTALPNAGSRACETHPGTLYVSEASQNVAVSNIGKHADRVRVLVWRCDAMGETTGGASPQEASFEAKGYVLRDGQWESSPVQVVPVREELFSRTKGILETDVFAQSRVFIAGLGSGGSYVAWELAKAGIANFMLMDHDRLEVVNVVRHMAGISDVGRYKTKVMADMIRDKNPYANVRTWETKVCWENAELLREIIRESDLVIAATDNRESRVILNKLCVKQQTPCIFAAAFRRAYGGQVLRVRPGSSPCYQCFLEALPEQARDEEISNTGQAEHLAYSDRPVAVEPGLSTDIAPISLMVVKLAIQELIQGKPTTLRSLDEDLQASWYLWLNRREAETEYADLEPLEFNVDGLHVLRWYGIALDRDPGCPCCGNFLDRASAEYGVEVSPEDEAVFC